MKRNVHDTYAPNWAPYFDSEGHILPDVNLSVDCSICCKGLAITKTVDRDHEPFTMLPCGHVFGFGCISYWLREQPTCPICRKRWMHGCCHHFNPREILGGKEFNIHNLPPTIAPNNQLPGFCSNCSIAFAPAHNIGQRRLQQEGPSFMSRFLRPDNIVAEVMDSESELALYGFGPSPYYPANPGPPVHYTGPRNPRYGSYQLPARFRQRNQNPWPRYEPTPMPEEFDQPNEEPNPHEDPNPHEPVFVELAAQMRTHHWTPGGHQQGPAPAPPDWHAPAVVGQMQNPITSAHDFTAWDTVIPIRCQRCNQEMHGHHTHDAPQPSRPFFMNPLARRRNR